jgi:hypothetical protein
LENKNEQIYKSSEIKNKRKQRKLGFSTGRTWDGKDGNDKWIDRMEQGLRLAKCV